MASHPCRGGINVDISCQKEQVTASASVKAWRAPQTSRTSYHSAEIQINKQQNNKTTKWLSAQR
eukprot:5046804-Lingulodinium_polyedra.AAC.1